MLAACLLPWSAATPWLRPDPAAVLLAVPTALAALLAAAGAVTQAQAGPPALVPAVAGCLLLALLADATVLSWLGLSGAVAVGLVASGRPLGVAWAASVLLALGGVVALSLAMPAGAGAWDGLRWSSLRAAAASCDPATLGLGFALLLAGLGGAAALVVRPVGGCAGALLASGLPGAFLLVLLRLRGVLGAAASAIDPAPAVILLGLLCVGLAVPWVWRRPAWPEAVAAAGLAQAGVAAFAVGLGGAGPVFAGLLLVVVLLLTRVALAVRLPAVALGAGLLAIAGLPPFGLFAGDTLALAAALSRAPLPGGLLALGLAAVGLGLLVALPRLLGDAPAPAWPGMLRAGVLLAAGMLLGFAMPGALHLWLRAAAAAAG
jgi:hydrogenase-4 component F